MSERLVPLPFDWPAMMPILAVLITGVLAMSIEMAWPRKNNNAIVWTCLIGLGAAAYLLIRQWGVTSTSPLFVSDAFGQVAQFALIAVAFLTVLYSEGYLRERRVPFGEYYPLVLWSTVGGMIMVTSRDLLIVFLGLEVLSIALYVLAGLSSKEKKSQESALKYFLLGAFASSFLLFGIAFVYGATGSTNVGAIVELVRLADTVDPIHFKMLYGGLGLILVGFGFKIAIVPFHQWTPDVYQGAPTTVTGFMAGAVKIASFVALVRFLEGVAGLSNIWIPLLSALAVVTMTIGNMVALTQQDVKRILAYSSIAHAGYLLVALAAAFTISAPGGFLALNTVAYYLLVYSLMTVGAFAVLSLSAKGGQEGTRVEDLKGLWQRAPFLAAMMVFFMASFAGIPPLSGFLAKMFIFMDSWSAGLGWLAIVLAINSVISAFYYLRIVLAVCVQAPDIHAPRFAKPNAGLIAACALSAAALVALMIGYPAVQDWMGLTPNDVIQASK